MCCLLLWGNEPMTIVLLGNMTRSQRSSSVFHRSTFLGASAAWLCLLFADARAYLRFPTFRTPSPRKPGIQERTEQREHGDPLLFSAARRSWVPQRSCLCDGASIKENEPRAVVLQRNSASSGNAKRSRNPGKNRSEEPMEESTTASGESCFSRCL